MTTPNARMTRAVEQLEGAMPRLNAEAERVEIWAAALIAFSKPIPDYNESRHEFMLPRAPDLPRGPTGSGHPGS